MPLFFECWDVVELNKDVPIFGDVFVLAAQCGHRIDADKNAALLLVRIKVASEIAQLCNPPLTRLGRALI